MPDNDPVIDLDSFCHFLSEDHFTERFWLVVELGTTLAVSSLIGNLLLSIFLALNRFRKNSIWTYLLILAICDVFVSVSYPLLNVVPIWYRSERNVSLKNIWMSYQKLVVTASNITISLGSFLILFAALERLVLSKLVRLTITLKNNRKSIIIAGLVLSVLSYGSMMFETQFIRDPKCAGTINENFLTVTSLTRNWGFLLQSYRTVFGILLSLLAFIAALGCMFAKARTQVYGPVAQKEADLENTNQATIRSRTLLLLAITNLMSPVLGAVIYAWEHIDSESLINNLFFYVIAIDMLSLLTIVACALRLLIYLLCEPEFRQDFKNFLVCKKNELQHSEVAGL
ncbi:hypothetical protein L596_012872 [Steinernema carpocapsae]|uniref:G-protein coupled receptors family 1 profile domain-containing protein n=1 Tax=Steinernema carpocapsae TaxID=34508 RepID=A0A4V6XWF7_STECR|nr:hypothetical protein L596_012872 [Steinernema carpocapsae]